MIKVQNLTKYYGPTAALQDVSFEVKKGEILGLLGPNAAGKTTTMRILTGFIPPSSGTASIAGHDVTTQSIEARRQIGYLPESVPLYTDMTVRSYLDFAAKLKGVVRDRSERVDEVMERCRIEDREDTLIGKLSKGYRQRVGIAQALIHNPQVLILDEPTVGLDPRQIIETRDLIKSLGGEHTVILSTHILPEVSMTCSRVIIINEGKAIAADTTENLTRRLKGSEDAYLEVRGPAEQVIQKLKLLTPVIEVEQKNIDLDVSSYTVHCELGSDAREEVATTIVQNGWGLLELRPLGMSLEDIFLKLITREEIED